MTGPVQPVPGPVPVPTDVDQQLERIARHWVAHRYHRATEKQELNDALVDWLDAHYPGSGDLSGRHRQRRPISG